MIEFVVDAVFLFDFAIVVVMIQCAVVEPVSVLLLFCLPQDVGESVSEVYGTYFAALGRADFCGVPCSVIADAPADCEVLLVRPMPRGRHRRLKKQRNVPFLK